MLNNENDEHRTWLLNINRSLRCVKERMKERRGRKRKLTITFDPSQRTIASGSPFLSFFLPLLRFEIKTLPSFALRASGRVIAVIQYGARTGNCSLAVSHLTSHGSVQPAEKYDTSFVLFDILSRMCM